MRNQRGAAELHFIPIVQNSVYWMRLVSRPHVGERRDVLLHGHHLSTGLLFNQSICRHVVPVGMAAQKNLDIREPESEFLHARTDHWNRFLVIAVDENMSLRRCDEERSKGFRADIIDVSNHLVRGKGLAVLELRILRQESCCAETGEQHQASQFGNVHGDVYTKSGNGAQGKRRLFLSSGGPDCKPRKAGAYTSIEKGVKSVSTS